MFYILVGMGYCMGVFFGRPKHPWLSGKLSAGYVEHQVVSIYSITIHPCSQKKHLEHMRMISGFSFVFEGDTQRKEFYLKQNEKKTTMRGSDQSSLVLFLGSSPYHFISLFILCSCPDDAFCLPGATGF